MEILLNSYKNINSVNVDNHTKVELLNRKSLITEYDIRNVLSATEVFDIEREANEIYRIYGKIEYLSLLNGLKNGNSTIEGYTQFSDFFLPQKTGNTKTLLNSFKFYLVKPAVSGYTKIVGNDIEYVRYFQVIATPNEFELYPVGFANNVYGEQAYAFNFNTDFDISYLTDEFGFPLTELFLYAQYIPTANGYEQPEILYGTVWSSTGVASRFAFEPVNLNIGDYIKSFFDVKIGDLIEYSKSQFYQTQTMPQTFYIQTPYKINGVTNKRLIWKYNPLIPFQLRYFSNELSRANSGNTSYELVSSIPYYATLIDTMGNYVWRTILPQGYIDPLTGIGVDYPFVNQKRYLFSSIVLDITPDLTDNETRIAFEDIWYTEDAVPIAIKPMGDINNIGKPCQ